MTGTSEAFEEDDVAFEGDNRQIWIHESQHRNCVQPLTVTGLSNQRTFSPYEEEKKEVYQPSPIIS